MIAATIRVAVTQGLLSTQSRKVPKTAEGSQDAVPASGDAAGDPHSQRHFGSTAVPDVAACQPVFKLTSRSTSSSDASESLHKAVRDLSHTTIDVSSSRVGHLTTLLPHNSRPLATSFVQSVLLLSALRCLCIP